MKIHLHTFVHTMMSKKVLLAWLPLAFTITAVCGFVSVSVQQNYRMGANDPQLQIISDYKYFLAQGQGVPLISSSNKIQIAQSLSPFIEFFNASSTFMTSSGNIGEDVPIPSKGVFDYTSAHGEDRFTWEPRPGLRLATVMSTWSGPNNTSGFVLAARNIKEVEVREKNLTIMSAVAWIVTMLGSLVLCAFATETSSHSHHA